ncbi:MAG: ATP-dependent RNA helicase [Amphiamblys sp. WSBS2006]|nr:MAG: ATP-dependent RNA helicase [Amphiamblys sp. WSBS2006]
MSFRSLGVVEPFLTRLKELKIETPTEVQKKCIPKILQGENIVGVGETGSGKTLSFVVPILQELAAEPYGVFAVVLAPTRELALQISEQFLVLSGSSVLRTCLLIGSMEHLRQVSELQRRPHIVIATPGRLAASLQRTPRSFARARFLVLDEADVLLSADFRREMDEIHRLLPSIARRLFFTATQTETLCRATAGLGISLETTAQAEKKIDEKYLFIPEKTKESVLFCLLKGELHGRRVIVFVSCCLVCEWLSSMLSSLSVECVRIHSKMDQADRFASIKQFKGRSVNVLVSTDIGARGLDVPSVHCVVNFDLPRTRGCYVHRIGRSGRRTKRGLSIAFVCRFDVESFLRIEEERMEEYGAVPDEAQVLRVLDRVGEAKKIAKVKAEDALSRSR